MPFQNRLLNSLSHSDAELLRPHLRPCTLKLGETLIEAHEPVANVTFVESGLLSVIADPGMPDQVEVGLIGWEGFCGISVLLGGSQSPFRTLVQRPGAGYQVAADRFRQALDQSRTLERLMLRYVNAYNVQISETARSNARFSVEQRLARWLLLAHDRTPGDELYLTHEFISMMLGVRRPGVTVATHVLEGEGIIRARRGSIEVRDRARLEAAAGGAYGIYEKEFNRLFGMAGPDTGGSASSKEQAGSQSAVN